MKKIFSFLAALLFATNMMAATDPALEAIATKTVTYAPIVASYFKDIACTELKSEYATKSDDEMIEQMTADGLPMQIQNMIIGVKNQWSGELNPVLSKQFRIQNYGLYPTAASTQTWGNSLYTDFNGATGIIANLNHLIYIFVGGDVPANTTLSLISTTITGMTTTSETLVANLKKGLNIVVNTRNNAYLWVMRTTSDNTVKVSEQSTLKIHIEGGYVMGCADLTGLSKSDAQAAFSTLLTNATNLLSTAQLSSDCTFPVLGYAGEMLFTLSAYSQMLNNENIYESVNNFDKLIMAYHNSLGITDAIFADYIKCHTPVFISNNADAAVYNVTSLLLQLGAPEETEAYSAKVDALKNAYNALSDAQKQMVDPKLSILLQFVDKNPTVALNSMGMATFSASTNLSIKTEGVKAYKASVNGEKIVLTELEGYIPAGTGVILRGTAGTTVEFEAPAASATAANVTGNALKATTKADGSLANKEANSQALKGETFLEYTGATFTANRAYLVR